ncbi:MAG: DUF1566 domain-containing protein [Deltaproteobacteria bacterium]|nr:DUF1566 domain-containing protein [Deltaproteobacteria bacterium]
MAARPGLRRRNQRGTYPACGAGQTGWRLPNINELDTLLNAGQSQPYTWLGTQGFTGVQADSYWSSTTYPFSPWFALSLELLTGNGTRGAAWKNIVYFHVWPVKGVTGPPAAVSRTGQTECYDVGGAVIPCAGRGQDGELRAGGPWPDPRFTDHFDGTVTDHLTGLTWLKDANCMATWYLDFDNDGSVKDGAVLWQLALDFVAGINAGTLPNCGAGHSDWRPPNLNELESLGNYQEGNLAGWLGGNGFLFDNVQPYYYHSSTTHVATPGFSTSNWAWDMIDGEVDPSGKGTGRLYA